MACNFTILIMTRKIKARLRFIAVLFFKIGLLLLEIILSLAFNKAANLGGNKILDTF